MNNKKSGRDKEIGSGEKPSRVQVGEEEMGTVKE